MESYQGWGLWCKGKHATGEILLLKGISKHPTSISGWSSCGIQDGCSSVFGWWLARSSNEEDLGAPGVLIPNPLRGKREPALPLGQKQESGERNQNTRWASAPWVRLSVAQLLLMQFVSHACGHVMGGRAFITGEPQPRDE